MRNAADTEGDGEPCVIHTALRKKMLLHFVGKPTEMLHCTLLVVKHQQAGVRVAIEGSPKPFLRYSLTMICTGRRCLWCEDMDDQVLSLVVQETERQRSLREDNELAMEPTKGYKAHSPRSKE